MDRVEEESPQHLAERSFPVDLTVHLEASRAPPCRVVQLRNPLLEFPGVALVGCGRLFDGGLGLHGEVDLSVVHDLASVGKLARQEPHQAAGSRGFFMGPVARAIRRDRLEDPHEPRLLVLENLHEVLSSIHPVLLFGPKPGLWTLDIRPQTFFLYPGPRSAWPGVFPVSLPSSTTSTPLTAT